jgi:hypothetical protein
VKRANNRGWPELDFTVAVFLVVPLAEPSAVRAGVLNRAEAFREVGSVLQVLNYASEYGL